MMLDPMATQHVPSLPPANPAPIDIHLDDDMITDTNSASDATMSASKTATSPAPMSVGSTYVKTQTHVQTPESAVEINQPPIPSPAEIQSTSNEVKIEIDGDESEANANPESVEKTNSAFPTPPKDPELSHITPTPAHDTTSEDGTEKDNGGGTDARATVTQSTKISTENEVESSKPQVAEVEEAEATKTESSIESSPDQEPKLSNTEATDSMDLDVVGKPGGKVKNAFSHDHDPNTPAEEVTHAQGGSDHQQIATKNVSPVDAPLHTPEPIYGASQSDDMTAQVTRLHVTYDSSGESRASEREEDKMEDDTVSGTQDEHTSSDCEKVMAPEPVVVDNNSTATTPESAENEEEGKILPPKPQGSLFGGPDGKQVLPSPEPPKTTKVDSIAETETPKGFEEFFEDGMTGISMQSQSLMDQAWTLNTGPFTFETSNAEEDAEPDINKDIEIEAVLGAQREASSSSPSYDGDAKPDISRHPSNTSSSYSHTTSSTNSQLPHKISATQHEDMEELFSSAEKYSQGAEAKDFSADYFNLEETSSDIAQPDTDQPVLETVEQEQLCNCEVESPCSHCIIREHNLRPGPRKDGYVHFGNQIPDTDKSGDYTDDRKYFLSTQQVSREDRDDDENTIGDEEAQDYAISLGLISDNIDLIGRFSNTVPFNKTDPLIRDKNPFDEESSSDESESKKSRKRKKKNKPTRHARQFKRPKITDITDNESDTQPTHPLSKASRPIKKTATRIRDSPDESDIQFAQRMRERSNALPHLSTTLGTLAESLRNRQPESRASKPTNKSPSKAKKKTTTTSLSPQPTLTITQMVQRVAKPLVTKLSYPISFNCPSDSCSLCSCPSYAIIGTGSPRSIKIYDFGQGNRELADAVAAGRKQTMQRRPESTKVCLVCTTKYLKVLMCKVHDVMPLDISTVFDTSDAVARATNKQCTKAELNNWCSLCPAPATYSCDKNCGAKFCDTCAPKVYAEDGNLTAMLDQTPDKVTAEYPHGLRADVELLRKGGELEKFLARMASGAGRNRG
ncbi:hypothetical protein KCU81_g3642, partial [Aureobasidium melanogenum]